MLRKILKAYMSVNFKFHFMFKTIDSRIFIDCFLIRNMEKQFQVTYFLFITEIKIKFDWLALFDPKWKEKNVKSFTSVTSLLTVFFQRVFFFC